MECAWANNTQQRRRLVSDASGNIAFKWANAFAQWEELYLTRLENLGGNFRNLVIKNSGTILLNGMKNLKLDRQVRENYKKLLEDLDLRKGNEASSGQFKLPMLRPNPPRDPGSTLVEADGLWTMLQDGDDFNDDLAEMSEDDDVEMSDGTSHAHLHQNLAEHDRIEIPENETQGAGISEEDFWMAPEEMERLSALLDSDTPLFEIVEGKLFGGNELSVSAGSRAHDEL
jgi:hypothetical protein